MDRLGGDTQSLEEAKNKYFAEMQQLKDIITKLKNYQNLNRENLETSPPDAAMLQERDALRKEAYEKNQFMKQLITQLREMMFDLNTVTSGIPS
jgi:predicted  nucleic acid-binding Zn-ribbon protein